MEYFIVYLHILLFSSGKIHKEFLVRGKYLKNLAKEMIQIRHIMGTDFFNIM